MIRKKVYVNAHPKSGTTWLIHLLCDLLDSPQTGIELSHPLVWGPRQDGGYQIIKQHSSYEDIPKDGMIVFLQRDIRDVIVSFHFYNGGTEDESIEGMLNTVLHEYTEFYEGWINTGSNHGIIKTSYEKLKEYPVEELKRIGYLISGKSYSDERIKKTIERQNIENMRNQLGAHFVRKGIVGDWKNYFNKRLCKKITNQIGDLMIKQGYINSLNWWKDFE